jgi:hypothetical protein
MTLPLLSLWRIREWRRLTPSIRMDERVTVERAVDAS